MSINSSLESSSIPIFVLIATAQAITSTVGYVPNTQSAPSHDSVPSTCFFYTHMKFRNQAQLCLATYDVEARIKLNFSRYQTTGMKKI